MEKIEVIIDELELNSTHIACKGEMKTLSTDQRREVRRFASLAHHCVITPEELIEIMLKNVVLNFGGIKPEISTMEIDFNRN